MNSPTMKLIAEKIKQNRRAVWDWHSSYAHSFSAPFYCSVDLRDSGHKIVPVDSNLFPAGFNNICPEDLRTAPFIVQSEIDLTLHRFGISEAKKILIIPESHTQNQYYIENLYYLNQVIQNAGYETQVGWYGPLPKDQLSDSDRSFNQITLTSVTQKQLIAHPIEVNQGILTAGGFQPDLILLNNDFSSGYPELLDQVKQPIIPSHTLGWHSRKKSEHFKYYNRLAGEFAQIIGIDPWIIQIDTEEFGPVNFNEDLGIEEVAQAVDRVLERTRSYYLSHRIERKPFAFVKNNSGTYGMGIMVVHSGDELRQMNRRTKNKMSVGKNRLPIQSVVIQEGIPTTMMVDRLIAEPVIYLFGTQLIGGFLRSNSEKGDEDNLNSQGMVFRKLCMSDLRTAETDPEDDSFENEPTLELVYGSIARISALATGMELAHRPQPKWKDQMNSPLATHQP